MFRVRIDLKREVSFEKRKIEGGGDPDFQRLFEVVNICPI